MLLLQCRSGKRIEKLDSVGNGLDAAWNMGRGSLTMRSVSFLFMFQEWSYYEMGLI